MTLAQQNRERLTIAISELEEALDYLDSDEAFALFDEFRRKIKAVIAEKS